MADVQFKHVKGFSELIASLRELPDKLQKEAMRRAVGAAARVVRNESRALFRAKWQVQSGRLVRSIVLKYIPEKSKNGKVVYYVLVKKVNRRYANNRTNRTMGRHGKVYQVEGNAYYWRFLEFGTAFIRGKSFMRAGFENKKMQAIEEMRVVLKDAIARMNLKASGVRV